MQGCHRGDKISKVRSDDVRLIMNLEEVINISSHSQLATLTMTCYSLMVIYDSIISRNLHCINHVQKRSTADSPYNHLIGFFLFWSKSCQQLVRLWHCIVWYGFRMAIFSATYVKSRQNKLFAQLANNCQVSGPSLHSVVSLPAILSLKCYTRVLIKWSMVTFLNHT